MSKRSRDNTTDEQSGNPSESGEASEGGIVNTVMDKVSSVLHRDRSSSLAADEPATPASEGEEDKRPDVEKRAEELGGRVDNLGNPLDPEEDPEGEDAFSGERPTFAQLRDGAAQGAVVRVRSKPEFASNARLVAGVPVGGPGVKTVDLAQLAEQGTSYLSALAQDETIDVELV